VAWGATVGGAGVVVDQDGVVVTLRYARQPKTLPSPGQLVLDIGPTAISLRRQRDAVSNVRAGVAVRPQLRQLLLDVSSQKDDPAHSVLTRPPHGARHVFGL
jgi:hypothetical protein